MKKVLVLNGSPKKEESTTMLVTNNFLKGLESTGEYKSETIHVSSLNVKPCRGCLCCWGRTNGKCVIQGDDVQMVKDKILEADVIILSFPIFIFGLPGELKVLMDRLLSLLHRYEGLPVPEKGPFHGFSFDQSKKKFIVIPGCAWSDWRIFAPIEMQFDCLFGKGEYTTIFAPQIRTAIAMKIRPRFVKFLTKYEAAGREFAENGCLSEETKANVIKPYYSDAVYKQLVDSFWEIEDGAYRESLAKKEKQG